MAETTSKDLFNINNKKDNFMGDDALSEEGEVKDDTDDDMGLLEGDEMEEGEASDSEIQIKPDENVKTKPPDITGVKYL